LNRNSRTASFRGRATRFIENRGANKEMERCVGRLDEGERVICRKPIRRHERRSLVRKRCEARLGEHEGMRSLVIPGGHRAPDKMRCALPMGDLTRARDDANKPVAAIVMARSLHSRPTRCEEGREHAGPSIIYIFHTNKLWRVERDNRWARRSRVRLHPRRRALDEIEELAGHDRMEGHRLVGVTRRVVRVPHRMAHAASFTGE